VARRGESRHRQERFALCFPAIIVILVLNSYVIVRHLALLPRLFLSHTLHNGASSEGWPYLS
jgi:hypothetical protein